MTQEPNQDEWDGAVPKTTSPLTGKVLTSPDLQNANPGPGISVTARDLCKSGRRLGVDVTHKATSMLSEVTVGEVRCCAAAAEADLLWYSFYFCVSRVWVWVCGCVAGGCVAVSVSLFLSPRLSLGLSLSLSHRV